MKDISDKRILIENVILYLSNPEEIKEIMDKTNVGFCFDLNHAISYSKNSNRDMFEVIKEFLKLKPKHFHIAGQNFLFGKDISHLSLNKFDWNWKEILSLYPKNAEITLETTTNIKKVEKDVEFIRKILENI